MLSAAEEVVGEYLWGHYDILVLPPSFPYGGMENPCLTFVSPSILVRHVYMYTCIHVHVYMYNVHVHMYMYVHQYEVAGIESTVYSMGYKCTCTYNIMLVCAGWRSIAGRCHSS